MRDVGLAVGDCLGLGARRGAEYDHAGAEAIAGVVEERPGTDEHALGFEIMNELVVQLGQLLQKIHHAIRPRFAFRCSGFVKVAQWYFFPKGVGVILMVQ